MRPPSTKLQVFANSPLKKNVTTLYRHPYSPDLAPPDYFLFPKLKMKLKGLHFADVAEIQEAVSSMGPAIGQHYSVWGHGGRA